MADDEIWKSTAWIAHTRLLLDSYERWLGTALISRQTSELQQSKELFEVPFVVLSHGTQADPILNYGNAVALKLWEMDVTTFTQTPSRYTAEPVQRDDRAAVLARTTRDGYVDDYRGIRISGSGKRFQIDRATVWNLVGPQGTDAGQAATFTDWRWLATS
ncbi:MAG: MEKHLA domain-containing protein [Pirellulaceae bacterium]|nr:MEKHLA domain-containing protein [Pirellulaceae bacterium]